MYQQRPVQRPPPGRQDNRYPPQAQDWHSQAQGGYYNQGYDDHAYDDRYYQYDDERYDNAGYDSYDGYAGSAPSAQAPPPPPPPPPQSRVSPRRAEFGPPTMRPYEQGPPSNGPLARNGYGYGDRRFYSNEAPRPPNSAGKMQADRPPVRQNPPRQGARPPPSPAKGSWDSPFPVFPTKPKGRPPPQTGLETDMAAMSVRDVPPAVRSPGPQTPREQTAYRPMAGPPTRPMRPEGPGRPLRSASGRQPAVRPPSDNGAYGRHPGPPQRSYTFASEPEPPPPVQHIVRSATLPVTSSPPISPTTSGPMYPWQATYQETPLSPATSSYTAALPRPSTAGSFRPAVRQPVMDVGAAGQAQIVTAERLSDSHHYGTHAVIDNYYDSSSAGEPEMPNFDAMPDNNSGMAVDESLPGLEPPRPKTPASSSGGQYAAYKPDFIHQPQHAKSQPNLRAAAVNDTDNGFEFGFANDAPPVPPVTRAYAPSNPPNLYEEPMRMQYPQRQASRGPAGPIAGGYPPRGPTPQQYSNNVPPRPYRVNTPALPTPIELSDPQQKSSSLSHHPAPFRPGLVGAGSATAAATTVSTAAATPVRQLSKPLSAPQSAPVDSPSSSKPVTHEEIRRLQDKAKSNPKDPQVQLLLAKKLAEAATVLFGDESRMDIKARAKAREKYTTDAHKIVKRLAHNGYPEAQFYLADCYGQGTLGLQPDSKEAFHLYHSAAKQGHAKSAYRVAVCYEIGQEEGGGTKRDPFKAVQWYKRSASLGYPPAMYKMGMILLKGLLGQARTPREGVSWLKRAADKADAENPHALHELALMHESSQPNNVVIHDEEYARQLFQQAAELGYKFSQFRLGAAYEHGLMGCPIDQRQSIYWYSRAAAQGEHQSELALSGWYLTGAEGILQQSDTEAYLWARKAATAGLPKAEYAMGYFTEVGIGVSPNLEDAKRWYWRAAAQGYPKARERLEDLKKGGGRMQKTRVSRSAVDRQNEGDCVVM